MSAYTDQELADIGVWLKKGLSASQIAKKLSADRGQMVSRNAIIGIVHRNRTLKTLGFANATGSRTERSRKKQTLPKARPLTLRLPKVVRPRPASGTAPYQLPGRLFIAAIEEIDRDGEAYDLLSRPSSQPLPVRQPHFAAMRFVDCLFDRCRAPLSPDLKEKPGPDMLCCGHLVEPLKPYCSYHEVRLCDRRHEYLAVAA